eukprot:4073132-Pyramimonas_sp.AAC.1
MRPDDVLAEFSGGNLRGSVRSSPGRTYSSGGQISLIDYFVISSIVDNVVKGSVRADCNTLCGVHFLLSMELGFDADQVLVRAQAPCQRLPFQQQLGPPVQPLSYEQPIESREHFHDGYGGFKSFTSGFV